MKLEFQSVCVCVQHVNVIECVYTEYGSTAFIRCPLLFLLPISVIRICLLIIICQRQLNWRSFSVNESEFLFVWQTYNFFLSFNLFWFASWKSHNNKNRNEWKEEANIIINNNIQNKKQQIPRIRCTTITAILINNFWWADNIAHRQQSAFVFFFFSYYYCRYLYIRYTHMPVSTYVWLTSPSFADGISIYQSGNIVTQSSFVICPVAFVVVDLI